MNPFSVKTPETLTPEDIASLFIDVFSDFPRLLANEHTFLHGARGTGKSMMFRYMEPAVQLAAHKIESASELERYAVHMPIKNANYYLSELERLEGAPYWLLAEHFLIINASLHVLKSLTLLASRKNDSTLEDLDLFNEEIKYLIDLCSSKNNNSRNEPAGFKSTFEDLTSFFEKQRSSAKNYIAKLAFVKDLVPYSGLLLGYEEFFLPFLRMVKELSFTPKGPIFLMLDDADNLPLRMQNIINGWVSYRSNNYLCLKISTQQKYKTWRTPQGILIESSHDFSEIDISSVYTSKNFSHYYDRVEKVVRRRLEVAGIKNSDPLVFFPINNNQKESIENIKKKIGSDWDNGNKISSRKNDDIRRYAVSEYIKTLGQSKKTNMYSYSGFKSMVDISSGMIRFFLEPAARMFSEQQASRESSTIDSIPHEVQDAVLYKWSEEYILSEFDRLRKDESTISAENLNKVEKLKRLINSFGECFQKKLVSSDSERQFISFMVTSAPSEDIQEVLDLAVEWGYLTAKTIARKEGFGRNISYTLNRRLAPYFKLDPSGYAAHLSVTPEMLKLAVEDPRAFVRDRLASTNSSLNKVDEKQQILDL